MITFARVAPKSVARAVVHTARVQQVLATLGLSAATVETPKVVRARALNAAGLQVMRVLLSRFLYWRRTRRGSMSALAATLAREGIVVIPNFLPESVFDAVRAEFRRGLEHASTLPLRKTGSTHVHVQYEDSSKRVGRFEEGAIDHDYVIVRPQDSDFPAIRDHLLENRRLLDLIREISGGARVFAPRGDLDRLYLSKRGGAADPQTALHEDIFCHDWHAWFTINAWNEENGAFTYAVRSHHLSISRVALEYWNSVTNTRDGGSWRVGPRAGRWLGLAPRSVCCPPNTLVLANTSGYHARGTLQPGHVREAVRMSFRINPWRD